MLQRVAVCCSVLQRVAACCSVLQCLSTGNAASLVSATFLEVASVLQCIAVCCSVSESVAVSFH